MPRRRQFKGIADNINQWILSRNFDIQGYWGLGKLYEFSEANNSSKVVLDLKTFQITPQPNHRKFNAAIKELAQLLHRSMESNKIPEYWLKEAIVTFSFKVPYQRKFHYWRSALGQPFICTMYIKTDIERIYLRETGGNCWIHDPKKEQRRYGFPKYLSDDN